MKTIYKYTLAVEESQTISIPEGAEFLSVIEQNNLPVVYFLVGPNREDWPISFHLVGTGLPIGEDFLKYFLYLGTVSIHSALGRRLVWHIFAQQTATWSKK